MKYKYLIVLFIILLGGILLSISLGGSNQSPQTPIFKEGCRVETVIDTVRGASMEPMIHDGDELEVLDNYYHCGGILERGDIVILKDSATPGPYVKILKALPRDTVAINTDNSISINGEVMKNSDGQVYIFDAKERNFLGLYIQNNILQHGAHFVFGDNISSSRDSRKFGAISSDSFIGKVVKVKERQ